MAQPACCKEEGLAAPVSCGADRIPLGRPPVRPAVPQPKGYADPAQRQPECAALKPASGPQNHVGRECDPEDAAVVVSERVAAKKRSLTWRHRPFSRNRQYDRERPPIRKTLFLIEGRTKPNPIIEIR